MGCGGKETSLETFESYLKKLLHIIDRLPKLEREKAVMILKNSANQYYNLTVSQPLQATTISAEFPNPTTTSTSLSYTDPIPPLPSSSLLDTSSPFSPPIPALLSPSKSSPTVPPSRLESESILAEISDLAGPSSLTYLGAEDTAESESWDRHLDTQREEEEDTSTSYYTSSPTCALCLKTFDMKEFVSHYQPVSCIGCRSEVCNKEIFALHYHTCKGIKHYESKIGKPTPSLPKGELSQIALTHSKASGSKPTNSKKQVHKCSECFKTFLTAFQLNKHSLGHNNNNCSKCDAKFAKRRLLVAHLKSVHYISTAEKYYHCKFCTRKFVKKPSLWAHFAEHTVGSQVVCLKCGQILEDEQQMEKHTNEHKNNAQHTCERCGEFFVRKQQYLVHLVGHDKYRCKICGKDFSSKKKLKYHRNTDHDPSNVSKPKVEKILASAKHEDFCCVVCLQSYKNETLFKAHDCSKESKSKEKLKNQAKDVTIKLSAGRFKCRFCEFEHKKCSAVVRHARIHKNKKRFVCEQCGSAFNAHYTLKEHRAYVHSDIRKHPCSKCGKSFKARNALIRHEQVHSDKRPFQCHCGQMYKRSSHLRRHLATSHQGEEAEESEQMSEDVKNDWEKERVEQNWQDDQARFKTSGWEHGREQKMGLTASAALDVVTTLDLNMRTVESKQEKEEGRLGKVDKSKILYTEREARDTNYQVEQEKVYEYRTPFPQHKTFPVDSHRYHGDRYMGVQGESGSRYYQGVGGRTDKMFPSPEKEYQAHDKLYLPGHDKTYPLPPLDKSYLSPPPTTSGPGSDRSYPLVDRNYTQMPSRQSNDQSQMPSRPPLEQTLMTSRPSLDHTHMPPRPPVDHSQMPSRPPLEHSQIANRPPLDHSQMSSRPHTHIGRVSSLDQVFSDSGPADLTMTGPRSDLAGSRPPDHQLTPREDPGLYSRGSQAGPRQRYSNYLNQRQMGDSVGRSLTYHPHTSFSPRVSDSSRPISTMDHSRLHLEPTRSQHHLNSSNLPGRQLEPLPPGPLDTLEDPYRPLPDLGYTQRQPSHYFDQLDSYLQHQGREEIELGQGQGCDKKKYYKSDKYYRGDQDVMGLHHHREDGGLLPPLLALAPQHPGVGPGPPSPHTLKMDYLCSQAEHLPVSQYLADSAMDYNNIEYN